MGLFSALTKPREALSNTLTSRQPRGWRKQGNIECDFAMKIVPDNDTHASRLIHTVTFKQDSIEYANPLHHQALDIIGQQLPKDQVEFYLYGYASHEGDSDYNDELSCARANAVKDVLANTHHQNVQRAAGLGEISPDKADAPPNPEHRKVEIWVAYERPKKEDIEKEDPPIQKPDRTECWKKNGPRMAAQFPSAVEGCIMKMVKKHSDGFTRLPEPGYWDQFLLPDDVEKIDDSLQRGLEKDDDGMFKFPDKFSSHLSDGMVYAACVNANPTDADLKRSASIVLGGVHKGLNRLDFKMAMAWGDKKVQDVWARVRKRHEDKTSIYGCYPIPEGSLNLE